MTADRRAALDALLAADAELVMDIDTTAVKRRAALVEAVAQAISNAWDSEQRIFDAAEAAIAIIRGETLEEAARVADAEVQAAGTDQDMFDGGRAVAGRGIAAAIRELARPNNGLTEPSAEVSAIP